MVHITITDLWVIVGRKNGVHDLDVYVHFGLFAHNLLTIGCSRVLRGVREEFDSICRVLFKPTNESVSSL
jgi:hypothetical protein